MKIKAKILLTLLSLFLAAAAPAPGAPAASAAGLTVEEAYPFDAIASGVKKDITSEIILERTVADDKDALLDDSLPQGAKEILPLKFETGAAFSGTSAIALASGGREIAYFVAPESRYAISTAENIVFYAKTPAGQTPKSFVIAFYDETGSSEHRACFGANEFDFGGTPGTFSAFNAGDITAEPDAWHRVIVPASELGLGGRRICGVLLAKSSGKIYIDKITRSQATIDPQKNRFEKVENILTIYRSSFSRLLLTPDPAAAKGAFCKVALRHSNGRTYRKTLPAGDGPAIDFDLVDDSGTVIPSGRAAIELEYIDTSGAKAKVSAEYDVLQLIANIQLPWRHSLVNATVPVFGDALGMDFSHYTVSVACLNPGSTAEVKICESREPKFLLNRSLRFGGKATVMGNLASFNAGTNFGYKYDKKGIKAQQPYNGLYRLMLTVYDTHGNARTDTRDIIVGRLISNTAEQFVESPDARAALIVAPYNITEGFTMCSLIDAAAFLNADSPVYSNDGFKRLSPVYEARPRGLEFDRPALLRIALPGEKLDTGSVAVFKYKKDAGWVPLETVIDHEGELTSPVAGFNGEGKTYFAAFAGNIEGARREKASALERTAMPSPAAPPIEVSSPTHPFLAQCDFENGYSLVAPRSMRGAVETLFDAEDKAGGAYSLKIVNKTSPSDFGALIYPRPFDASKYPVLSFDYKCPPTVEINIMLKTASGWFEIPLSAPTAGSAIGHRCLERQEFIRDGAWHKFRANLFELLKNASAGARENEPLIVEEIFFCDYDYEGWAEVSDGHNPPGAFFNIDNLSIACGGSNSRKIEFRWRANDPAIVKFRWSIDDSPYGVASGEASQAVSAAFEAPEGSGKDMWYLHITGCDAGGKPILATSHYAVKVDGTPPEVVSTSPADGGSSPSAVITAVIDDHDGSGVNAASIKCELDGYLFESGDGALTYDSSTKTMKIEPFKKSPAPPGFIDGQSVRVRIFGVRDNAGNEMKREHSFAFTADFSSMTAGRDVLITTEGGHSPCFTPDSKTIIYCARSQGRERLFSIRIGDKKPVMLSRDANADYAFPCVKSDSTVVACKRPAGKSNYELVSMAADGSGEKKLLALPGTDILTPAVSQASPLIYFSAGNELFSFEPKTSAVRSVASDPNAFMLEPAVSPDGKTVAFRKDLYTNTIWLCGPDGSNHRALTLDGFEFFPAFMSGGAAVAFVRREGEASAIYTVNIDGSGVTQIVPGGLYQLGRPAISPDGRYLAYESTRNGLWNISMFTLIYAPQTDCEVIAARHAPSGDGKEPAAKNPPSAKLTYGVTDDDTLVTVKIYSADGTPVRTLAEDKKEFAGPRALVWDAKDDGGKPVDADKPYIVRYEFRSKNSAAPAVKAAKIALGPKAAETAVDFAAVRRSVQADECKRRAAEAGRLARLADEIRKGGDDVPPAPVSGFKATPGIRMVELSWNANNENDLAGYVITRVSKETGARAVFKVAPQKTSYADTTAESGKTCAYSISAIDACGNASAARELLAAAEFERLYYAVPYAGSAHLLKLDLNELAVEILKSENAPPALASGLAAPDNLSGGSFTFACHEGFYTVYCLDAASGELYYSRSSNLKSFSGWEMITAEYYPPPDAGTNTVTAFICPKDAKTVKALCLDRDSDTLYEGEIRKNSSKISWKTLCKGFIPPPCENALFTIAFANGKYTIYVTGQNDRTVYATTTASFKSFAAWREEILD